MTKTLTQYTATVAVEDTTLEAIQAAAKQVKAGDNARVTTGGYFQPEGSEEPSPFSVTFTWSA